MPWSPKDAAGKTRKASTPKAKRRWADVADSVLERTGDEGLAVREANGITKRDYRGRGNKAAKDAKGRSGKRRSWNGA